MYNNQQTNIQYVVGRQGAESFSMFPNSRSLLMDSMQDIFYIVNVDIYGTRTIKSYEFKELPEDHGNEFITKNELISVLDSYFNKFNAGGNENEQHDESVNGCDAAERYHSGNGKPESEPVSGATASSIAEITNGTTA